jgi:DNA-binding LacI/PurR family transcriptional regulator
MPKQFQEQSMSNVRLIAKQAGVSISSVSRVLNNQPGVSESVRAAVLAAVNEAGYVPEVGRRSTTNVALIYTHVPTLESPFDAALLSGIYAGLAANGWDLVILDVHRSRQPGETVTQMLLRKGVQGALMRTTTPTQGVCREVAVEGFPAVIVGSRPDGAGPSFVYSDSRAASREAVEYLLDLGHRRIVAAAHVVDDSDHADRIAGYREALEGRGVRYDESLVLRVPAEIAGGAQVVRRLAMMAPRPTAVFLADPLTAVGVVAEARRAGLRIPEDLSVVGFDDADLRAATSPQLTAVCQDARALGSEAVALLSEVVSAAPGSPPQSKALRCWLEVHESTGPAPRDAPR